MTFFDILSLIMAVCFGFFALAVFDRGASQKERAWSFQALAFQIVLSVGLYIVITQFYSGDMLWYTRTGQVLREQVIASPSTHFPDLVGLLVQRPQVDYLDAPTLMAGSSTGSMHAASALFMLLTGASLLGTCVIIGVFTFFSKLLMYKTFRDMFPAYTHTRIFIALMYLPSVGFWAGGLLKESFAIIGMGPILWGLSKVMRGQLLRGAVAIAAGGFIVSLFKAYVLFPLVLSGAVAWYWYTTLKKHGRVNLVKSPIKMLILFAVGVGGILLLGKAFPEYSVDNIAEETANLQSYGAKRDGRRANYAVGDHTDTSLSGQASFLPIGLVFSLFRPLPFEVRNPAMLINALEMLVLIAFWFKVLTVRSPRKTWGIIIGHPLLMLCLLFVLGFGSIVGIATTNVGTLSRYRVPMMPLYALLLAVLSLKMPSERRAPSSPTPQR